jgi:hypothetical protein
VLAYRQWLFHLRDMYRNSAAEEFSMTIDLINQPIPISTAERGLPGVETTGRFARLLGLA